MAKLLIRFTLVLCLFLLAEGRVCCQPQPAADSSQTENSNGNGSRSIVDSNYLADNDSLVLPFSLRQVEDKKVKGYQHNPVFAFANDPAYWKEVPSPPPGMFLIFLQSRFVHFAVIIILLLVLGYAILRLAKENSFRWFERRVKKSGQKETETVAEEEFPADPDEAIRRHIDAGNFGLAVRSLYLKLIHTAFKKNVIPVKASSTNAEMASAFKDLQQAQDFRFLANVYEFIFYGGFVPSRDQFDLLRQKFDAFDQTMQI